jgi:hypothetical protein
MRCNGWIIQIRLHVALGLDVEMILDYGKLGQQRIMYGR